MKNLETLILVDKPSGITSFDVIRRLRKKIGYKKMGHSGTLDPLASGLMIIGCGEGTKLLKNLIALPKTYRAKVSFGKQTSTGDSEGDVISTSLYNLVSLESITSVLGEMRGAKEYTVPLFSAIKKDGKPLYEYARKNEKVELPKKLMTLNDFKCEAYENGEATIFFDVESGTYIRTLAEVLAQKLNTVAHLTELRRLTIGNYSIDDEKVLRDLT
jgi:tRNA pseudouridine55 synthase